MSPITENTERTIGYASGTFNEEESNYPTIDKEDLSVIFGVTKFQPYLASKVKN